MHPEVQSYLEPKGINNSTDGKQRENPEGTEDGGQEELQPRPNAVMKGGVTQVHNEKQQLLGSKNESLLNFQKQPNIPMIFAVWMCNQGMNTWWMTTRLSCTGENVMSQFMLSHIKSFATYIIKIIFDIKLKRKIKKGHGFKLCKLLSRKIQKLYYNMELLQSHNFTLQKIE